MLALRRCSGAMRARLGWRKREVIDVREPGRALAARRHVGAPGNSETTGTPCAGHHRGYADLRSGRRLRGRWSGRGSRSARWAVARMARRTARAYSSPKPEVQARNRGRRMWLGSTVENGKLNSIG